MINRGSCIVGFALLGFAFGCAEAEPATEALGSKQEAIWNSQADTGPGMDPYHNAVVRLTNLATSGICTGFYVTSTLIVSAAHCNVGAESGPPPGGINVGDTVLVGRDATAPDTTRTIKFMQTRQSAPIGPGTYEHDIMLIETDAPVLNEAFAQKPRFVMPPLNDGVGTFPFLIMGFGRNETGKTPPVRQMQFVSGQPIRRVNDQNDDNMHLWFHDFGDDPYRGPDNWSFPDFPDRLLM